MKHSANKIPRRFVLGGGDACGAPALQPPSGGAPQREFRAQAPATLKALAEAVAQWATAAELDCFRPHLDEAAERYGASLVALAAGIAGGVDDVCDLVSGVEHAAENFARDLKSLALVAIRRRDALQ